MNDSRIQRNMKIARDDSAVKLGCSDLCGLPLKALEKISEKGLIFHWKGGRCEACFTSMTGDRHDKLAAMDLSMIAVALTPSFLV